MTLTPEMGKGHWTPEETVKQFVLFSDRDAATRMRDRAARELAEALDKMPDDKPLLAEKLCIYRWLEAVVNEPEEPTP